MVFIIFFMCDFLRFKKTINVKNTLKYAAVAEKIFIGGVKKKYIDPKIYPVAKNIKKTLIKETFLNLT